ncbi:MAG: hypothetical protein IVW53_01675 [Chloroflexi bacterium]|nr:hypothetical protein [Chloroflexota bacterium]
MARIFLVLALIVTMAACSSSPTPPPSVATPSAAPPAFSTVIVTAVGSVPRGGSSGTTLVLSFGEAGPAAFGRGPGSFEVTISDHAGSGATVTFTGSPSTAKSPGSLGATATIAANVLTIHILDSDTVNIEPIIVTGIGIAASPSAAVGSIGAVMGSFSGSLAGGATNDVLAAPGVIAGP